jgi:hypothetical protein
MLNWLTSEDNGRSAAILFTLLVFIGSLLISRVVLPENCLIIEYREVGFLCDGFSPDNQTPCPACQNEGLATVARIFVLFGIVSSLVAPLIFWIRVRKLRDQRDSISIVEN